VIAETLRESRVPLEARPIVSIALADMERRLVGGNDVFIEDIKDQVLMGVIK